MDVRALTRWLAVSEGVKSFFFAVSTPQARGFGRSPDTREHRKTSAVSGSEGVRQLHQLAENGCEQFCLGPLETGCFSSTPRVANFGGGSAGAARPSQSAAYLDTDSYVSCTASREEVA